MSPLHTEVGCDVAKSQITQGNVKHSNTLSSVDYRLLTWRVPERTTIETRGCVETLSDVVLSGGHFSCLSYTYLFKDKILSYFNI